MKKRNIILIVLAFIMLLAVTSAFVPFKEAEKTENLTAPYASLGQDLYMTVGVNYDATPIIDGSISAGEGYVCVTPNGVDATVTSGLLGKVKSNTLITEVTPTADKQAIFEQISAKYYVAQDDDYVYFAVQQTTPLANLGITYLNSYLRLGFNPDDYTQQVILHTYGCFTDLNGGDIIVDGVTYKGYNYEPYKVVGLYSNDVEVSKKGPETSIIEKYVNSEGKPAGSDSVVLHVDNGDGTYTRIYEMKLSKSAIKSEYAVAFGVDESVIDFSAMYVGATYNGGGIYWANGTVVDANTAFASGVNTFIPDKIVFGTKK